MCSHNFNNPGIVNADRVSDDSRVESASVKSMFAAAAAMVVVVVVEEEEDDSCWVLVSVSFVASSPS